jgi:hypothetical protein
MVHSIGDVAFATMHGKEKLVAPILQRELGWSVRVADLNTDLFGTFSGEIPRSLSAHDTVVEKARRGALHAGLALGIASEGSIGAHPHIPFLDADVELMALVDVERNLQLVVSHIGPGVVALREVWTSTTDLEDIGVRADLPNHAVIVRKGEGRSLWARKGIRSVGELGVAIAEARHEGPAGDVVIESDFRAMMSPSRQANIVACATALASRVATVCPSCDTWGWGVVGVKRGMPCKGCGGVVEGAVRADILGCVACPHTKEIAREHAAVDPAHCETCNP